MKKIAPSIELRSLSREELSKIKGGFSSDSLFCDVSGCPRNECPAPKCKCVVVPPGVEVCNPVS